MEVDTLRISRVVVTVALPPRRAGDIESGVYDVLNEMLFTYDAAAEGIVLGYKDVRVLSPEAELLNYLPFLKLDVEVTMAAFCPEKGTRLRTDQIHTHTHACTWKSLLDVHASRDSLK